jgi:hypothetical protein
MPIAQDKTPGTMNMPNPTPPNHWLYTMCEDGRLSIARKPPSSALSAVRCLPTEALSPFFALHRFIASRITGSTVPRAASQKHGLLIGVRLGLLGVRLGLLDVPLGLLDVPLGLLGGFARVSRL